MGLSGRFTVVTLALLFGAAPNHGPSRKYFKPSFDLAAVARLEKQRISFNDTIPNDTLYVCFDRENLPIACYREIMSGVCLDGACRPVYLNLYWSIPGDYLGYELKNNEVLTKNDHDPFSDQDYAKLHELLSDPISLLANYSLAEMTPEHSDSTSVDARSGATLADLSPYIVKGAAYTTHTLWHIVHDETRDSIQSVASRLVSFPLIEKLLTNPGTYDQLWALRQLPKLDEEAAKLSPAFKMILTTDNYFLKEQTLKSLAATRLAAPVVQGILLDAYPSADFGTKRMVIAFLSSGPPLQTDATLRLIKILPAEQNTQISLIFDLFQRKADANHEMLRTLSEFLGGQNAFLSKAAFTYLSTIKKPEPWLVARLKKYQQLGR